MLRRGGARKLIRFPPPQQTFLSSSNPHPTFVTVLIPLPPPASGSWHGCLLTFTVHPHTASSSRTPRNRLSFHPCFPPMSYLLLLP